MRSWPMGNCQWRKALKPELRMAERRLDTPADLLPTWVPDSARYSLENTLAAVLERSAREHADPGPPAAWRDAIAGRLGCRGELW